MRGRLGFAVLLALLLCSLAARELPELLHLCDNTSNDYSVTVFQHRVVSARQNQVSQLALFAVVPRAKEESRVVEVSFFNPLRPLPDPFPRLCVLRT